MEYKLLCSVAVAAVLDVISPTLSDILELLLIKKLCDEGYIQWGVCLGVPMVLNTIFMFITWIKTTETPKWNVFWWLELSLVKMYPQYRVVKILYLRWQKDPAHGEAQNAYDKTLSGKEKLIESLPQVLVKVGMLACAYMPNNNQVKADFQILLGNNQQLENFVGNVENQVIKEIISFRTLFFLSLFLAIFFSVLSVTNFFLKGQFKFLPAFFSFNFLITFLSVGLSFCSKIWVLGTLLFCAYEVYDTVSEYNPLGYSLIGYDFKAACKVVTIVQENDLTGPYNLATHATGNVTEYKRNGKVFVWQNPDNQWMTGEEECWRIEGNCSPISSRTFKAYCGDLMFVKTFIMWTVIFIFWLLVYIPQLFIMFCVLTWTKMFHISYTYPELILATMASNFTFGPARGGKKHTLVLHNGLTWVMTLVSFCGLMVAVMILEIVYKSDQIDRMIAFLLQGSHEHSDQIPLPIPPIFPIVCSLLAGGLTGLVLYMDNCLTKARLLIRRSVYRGKKTGEEQKNIDSETIGVVIERST